VLRPVLPLLRDTLGFGEQKILDNAVNYEQAALKNLGRTNEAERVLQNHRAGAESFLSGVEKVLPHLESLDNEADPSRRKAIVEDILSKLDPASYFAAKMQLALTTSLRELGELERAVEVGNRARPQIRRWLGTAIERELLAELIEIEQLRNNFVAALELIAEYEPLARKLSGNDWRKPIEYNLGRIFYDLEELKKAEDALAAKTRRNAMEELDSDSGFGDRPGRDDKELLLSALILLKRGHTNDATRIVEPITKRSLAATRKGPVVDETRKQIALEILPEIAEIQAAVGRPREALKLLESFVGALDPAEDLSRWVAYDVRAAELHLEAGDDPLQTVKRFEELSPGLLEFPELNPINSVRMDIFLGEYYRKTKQPALSGDRLNRALLTAGGVGAVDEQILIRRALGELASDAGQLKQAAEQFGASISLLRSVSERIPSDIGKIGYRANRLRAIPLLTLTQYELYRQSGQLADAQAMLATAEEGKSRALTEMLLRKAGQVKSGPVDVSRLQAALPAGALLLEYYVPEGAGEEVFRFEVERNSLHVTRLDLSASQLDASALKLRETVCHDINYDDAKFRSRARELAAELLPSQLMTNQTGAPKLVYVVPTGALHLLPFFLLTDGAGKYLDEREELNIVHLPSAAILLRQRPNATQARHCAAFINPALEREQNLLLAESPQLRADLESALRTWADTSVIWERRLTPTMFLNDARTVENVFICAHARFLPDTPMASYIKFSKTAEAPGELTAEDLVTENFGRGLWSIAGCSTATGRVRSGGEVLGLPRALLQGGATMVVVSLWDVDTARSLQTMTVFYRDMAGGRSVADALHRARTQIRRDGGRPFDWAPFILIGFHDFHD